MFSPPTQLAEQSDMPDRILIIEDEEAIADVLRFALSAEGYDVVWKDLASDGYDAFQENGADLIVLDVGLPDENGFELCKRLRAESDVPVIFLTARKEEIDRIVGLEIGADDYVTKPFSPREVASRVKTILRRTRSIPQGAGQATSATGPTEGSLFDCDDERLQITFCNQALDLTRYEYRILKAMIEHPEKVFSRGQLMDHAWEEPEAAFERAVDTHIKGLRAKLRDINSALNPLRTHRGLGYSLSITL